MTFVIYLHQNLTYLNGVKHQQWRQIGQKQSLKRIY